MQGQLRKAVEVLLNGGIVAYPTDTVYGLGANGLDPAAVRRVFEVKRRPLTMPVPLLVADLAMLRSVVEGLPEVALSLVERFLPGPLTLVLPRAPVVPEIVTAGAPSVAVRIPDHPVPVRLAAGIGAPLVGTSANRSGQPSPTTADEVRAQLGAEIDWVVDGDCPGGVESTVVDLTDATLRILRPGAVPAEALEEVLASLGRSAFSDQLSGDR